MLELDFWKHKELCFNFRLKKKATNQHLYDAYKREERPSEIPFLLLFVLKYCTAMNKFLV